MSSKSLLLIKSIKEKKKFLRPPLLSPVTPRLGNRQGEQGVLKLGGARFLQQLIASCDGKVGQHVSCPIKDMMHPHSAT